MAQYWVETALNNSGNLIGGRNANPGESIWLDPATGKYANQKFYPNFVYVGQEPSGIPTETWVPDGSCTSGYSSSLTGACKPGAPALPEGAIEVPIDFPEAPIVSGSPSDTYSPPPVDSGMGSGACPKGDKYLASQWEVWFGCPEGYTRPQFSDYCVCQNGSSASAGGSNEQQFDLNPLGGINDIIKMLPTLIILMVFVSIIGAFRR